MHNAETRFKIQTDEFAWGAAREAARPLRGRVSLLVDVSGAVVCSWRNAIVLQHVSPAMNSALRYDAEDASELADELSKRTGRALVAVGLYDYAKARQYGARAALRKLAGESR